jgi:exosortase/archaeosortase
MKEEVKKKVSSFRKAELRYKVGNAIALVLLVAAYFNYIQFSTAVPMITLMVAYICFANDRDEGFTSGNKVMILSVLVALLSVSYFSQQNTKNENKERLEAAALNIVMYCESKLNSSSTIDNLNSNELINCDSLEETLNNLWEVNYGYDSDYDDGEFGLF